MKINNQIFAAPMAGITDRAFRKIMRKYSSKAVLLTEMISCHSVVGGHKNCLRNFDKYDDEGIVGAQIFGACPEKMGLAAKIMQDNGASFIDINMGCPVAKVATKAKAGAYLMKDHQLAGKIISSVVGSVSIPVSVKTRLGWDDNSKNWQDLIKIATDNGASFAALHGRTRSQLYTGNAKLEQKPDGLIPIIGNGDIKNIDDVNKVLGLGYDGAMIGRALYGQPWLLGQLTGELPMDANINIRDVIYEHMDMVFDYYGVKTGVPLFRKHIAWYSAGMSNANEFRVKINQTTDVNVLKSLIDEFFN